MEAPYWFKGVVREKVREVRIALQIGVGCQMDCFVRWGQKDKSAGMLSCRRFATNYNPMNNIDLVAVPSAFAAWVREVWDRDAGQ